MIDYQIGVIVGRFQVHKLHAAHKALIDGVQAKHKKVLIFLGVSPTTPSRRNPLDFKAREIMIRDSYPDVTVLPISDTKLDEVWSDDLDKLIRLAEPYGNVMLYGSRDSFVIHYTGHFPATVLESKTFISGTDVRKNVSSSWFDSPEFRAGVIYATSNCYKHVYPTVDIAIIRDNKEVLLAKKPNEKLLRFIGGFVDPSDRSFEDAAKREAAEETGLEVGNLTWVANFKVDDWRYKSEDDKIITTLFSADYIFGAPRPQDDVSELEWVGIEKFDYNNKMEECHRALFHSFWLWFTRTTNGKEYSTTDRLV